MRGEGPTFFGVKKQVRLILKYWRDFHRFLPFVNIALRSQDMFTAIWGHFAKILSPLYILIRTNAPKIGYFWPIFHILNNFSVFSYVTHWVTTDFNKKFARKCRVSIFLPFLGRELAKIQGNSLIFTKSRISQNHANSVL